jgi:thiol-disulfide isomerase/thioredoxin
MTSETPPVSLSRRRWTFGAVGAAAVAAGAGVAWWNGKGGSTPPSDAAVTTLWGLGFDTPAGGRLQFEALRGKPLVVNFWATWCPPCVEEMPLLDAFYRQNAANGWQIVGLAIDQPSAVRSFLARTPVAYPIGLAGLEGTELVKSLGNLNGGLPFTLVLGAGGSVLQRKMGRLAASDLALWPQLR